MITQKQFKEYFQNLYNSKAVYVWGANGEVITKELTDRLFSTYGSKTYDKTYYDAKYEEGKGRIGADCSGAFYPLSKGDKTAKGYYSACIRKGSINELPKDTACMIFNASFTHIGAYMGDGKTIEMRSGKMNVQCEQLRESRWAYYGVPSWLETDGETVQSETARKTEKLTGDPVIRNIQTWCNGYADAGLVIDGVFGPKTKAALCKALQYYLNISYGAGLETDGKFGPLTKAACKTISGKSELVYIAQAILYCLGYDMSHSIVDNNLDGTCGSGTRAAVLEYQKDHRGLKQDGLCGPATFYSMFC